MSPTRREFLAGSAGFVAAAGAMAAGSGPLLEGLAGANRPQPHNYWLPRPENSGIDHIVVVMMENRSFDHYLGWLPGADGRQAGLKYRDRDGKRHSTYHLTDFQGCDHPGPDHSYHGGRTQLNEGRCDGFLLTNPDDQGEAIRKDTYPIGYYTRKDLGFFGNAAPYWTTFDRYFAATMAPTMPNRFYLHSAQTDRIEASLKIDDKIVLPDLPTIWDRLADAKVSRRYYYSDVPYLALLGVRHLPISVPYAFFLADCALGTLPSVSFVDPRFLFEKGGFGGSDHPPCDIRTGQHFLNQIYKAVTNGPKWDRTALVITYDEWGGFFDHVPPKVAPDSSHKPDSNVSLDAGLRGFRVPAMLISPRARRHHVGHETYDHTSVLKMIEWRFGLRPLTVRDRSARNLAESLDFRRPRNLEAPQWDVPPKVPLPCAFGDGGIDEWSDILDVVTKMGFEIQSPG